MIARQQGRGLADLAAEAGAPVVGGTSLKAALDRDWDDPAERALALQIVLDALAAVEQWVEAHPIAPTTARDTTPPLVEASPGAAHQVVAQDVETAPDGTLTLRRGVAKDRRISGEDAQMRHGRKSKSHLFDGFTRHVLRDLDRGVIRAVALTPANTPEATATDDIAADLAHQQTSLVELPLDRASLSSFPGARASRRVGDLLQSLAGPQSAGLSPDPVYPGLADSDDHLSPRRRHPIPSGPHRALSRGRLCFLPAARTLHAQPPRPQRHDPSR